VLRGNLAPDGAVIKPAAAEPRCSAHRPAVVFEDYNDMAARIDATTSTSRPTRAGAAERRPLGGPACPSGACCRSRRSCCKQGVRDMVRISDARMSGTSYGACVLHVAPESFVGGPLALVRDGD
jgi:dihydroxyacid dehydratase/phosphogluconate dehydratase